MLSTDPVARKLDADGDLDLAFGIRPGSASGLEATANQIAGAVQLVKGEWFRDLDQGVPWFEGPVVPAGEAILGGRFDDVYTRRVIAEAIVSVSTVKTLVSLSLDFNRSTRTLRVEWKVTTNFGDLAGSTEV